MEANLCYATSVTLLPSRFRLSRYFRHTTSVTLPAVTHWSAERLFCSRSMHCPPSRGCSVYNHYSTYNGEQITLQKHRCHRSWKSPWTHGCVQSLHSALSTTIKVRTIGNEHEQITLQKHRLPPIAKKESPCTHGSLASQTLSGLRDYTHVHTPPHYERPRSRVSMQVAGTSWAFKGSTHKYFKTSARGTPAQFA